MARQATDVDRLSGGRLRLGAGIGWSQVEYEALAQDLAGGGSASPCAPTRRRYLGSTFVV